MISHFIGYPVTPYLHEYGNAALQHQWGINISHCFFLHYGNIDNPLMSNITANFTPTGGLVKSQNKEGILYYMSACRRCQSLMSISDGRFDSNILYQIYMIARNDKL